MIQPSPAAAAAQSRSEPAHEELSLIRRVAAKDRQAFEAIYRRYYPRLFQYLFKLTRQQDLVEEVLDDVMLVVWSSAASFSGRSRLSTWIFGIAYRKALKALRSSKRRNDRMVDSKAPEPIAPDRTDGQLTRKELAGALEKAVATLSPEQRAVVELTYYHDYSYPEIAEITGCPVNTVKTRMFHARRRLKEILLQLGVSAAGWLMEEGG